MKKFPNLPIDDIPNLKTVLKNASAGKELDKVDKDLITKTFKNVDDKQLREAFGASVKEVADVKKSALDFLKSDTGKILAIGGLTAGGLAALMLMTGKKDPAEALGDQLAKLTKAAGAGLGSAVGGGLGSAFSASGLSDFFKQWGLYIGLFCACLMMLGLFMMLK